MEKTFCMRARQLRRCFTILIILSPVPLYLLLYLNGGKIINLRLQQIKVFLISPKNSRVFPKAVLPNDIARPFTSNGLAKDNDSRDFTVAGGGQSNALSGMELFKPYEHINIFNDKQFEYRLALTAEEQLSTVQSNRSKIFQPRRQQMPATEKEKAQYEHLDLLRLQAPKFLPQFKNPCWYDENKLLRCLPYFYLIGAPKCGTTDLYNKLNNHEDFVSSRNKEPHWFTRWRFELNHSEFRFTDYLSHFSKLSEHLNNAMLSSDEKTKLITGDCSASTMWDNSQWTKVPRNDNPLEPVYTNADYIQHLNTNTKIIFILRNPITRLYSDYLYFEHESRKSPANFHRKVVDAIHILTACFRAMSLKSCVYNKIIHENLQVRLHIGIYFIYLIEWYKNFPRDQILPLQLEEYSKSLNASLQRVFAFLDMRIPDDTWFHRILNSRRVNIRNNRNINVGPMWIETRQLLYKFYKPFNIMLAQLLQDKNFDFGFS